MTGDDWSEQIHHLINTTDELPLDQLLPEFGIQYQLKQDKSLPFGLKLTDKPEGVLVQAARREGAAAKAGLSAHDVIVAIDGLKATTKSLEQYAKQDAAYTVHAFRRDEFMQFEVNAAQIELPEVALSVTDQAKVEQWLKG